jgi:hypothetical protein
VVSIGTAAGIQRTTDLPVRARTKPGNGLAEGSCYFTCGGS